MCTWEPGAHLERTFKKGKANGEGAYLLAKAVLCEGKFVEGKPASVKPDDCCATRGRVPCQRALGTVIRSAACPMATNRSP